MDRMGIDREWEVCPLQQIDRSYVDSLQKRPSHEMVGDSILRTQSHYSHPVCHASCKSQPHARETGTRISGGGAPYLCLSDEACIDDDELQGFRVALFSGRRALSLLLVSQARLPYPPVWIATSFFFVKDSCGARFAFSPGTCRIMQRDRQGFRGRVLQL